MVRRSDLDPIKDAAARSGFLFRNGKTLLHGDTENSKNAVHLIFSAEKSILPEEKHIHGKPVMVIPVADLVRMKLTSFRDKDRVHVRSMDAAGLITQDVEMALPPELAERLKHVRETE
jgi:hypothetical protein